MNSSSSNHPSTMTNSSSHTSTRLTKNGSLFAMHDTTALLDMQGKYHVPLKLSSQHHSSISPFSRISLQEFTPQSAKIIPDSSQSHQPQQQQQPQSGSLANALQLTAAVKQKIHPHQISSQHQLNHSVIKQDGTQVPSYAAAVAASSSSTSSNLLLRTSQTFASKLKGFIQTPSSSIIQPRDPQANSLHSHLQSITTPNSKNNIGESSNSSNRSTIGGCSSFLKSRSKDSISSYSKINAQIQNRIDCLSPSPAKDATIPQNKLYSQMFEHLKSRKFQDIFSKERAYHFTPTATPGTIINNGNLNNKSLPHYTNNNYSYDISSASPLLQSRLTPSTKKKPSPDRTVSSSILTSMLRQQQNYSRSSSPQQPCTTSAMKPNSHTTSISPPQYQQEQLSTQPQLTSSFLAIVSSPQNNLENSQSQAPSNPPQTRSKTNPLQVFFTQNYQQTKDIATLHQMKDTSNNSLLPSQKQLQQDHHQNEEPFKQLNIFHPPYIIASDQQEQQPQHNIQPSHKRQAQSLCNIKVNSIIQSNSQSQQQQKRSQSPAGHIVTQLRKTTPNKQQNSTINISSTSSSQTTFPVNQPAAKRARTTSNGSLNKSGENLHQNSRLLDLSSSSGVVASSHLKQNPTKQLQHLESGTPAQLKQQLQQGQHQPQQEPPELITRILNIWSSSQNQQKKSKESLGSFLSALSLLPEYDANLLSVVNAITSFITNYVSELSIEQATKISMFSQQIIGLKRLLKNESELVTSLQQQVDEQNAIIVKYREHENQVNQMIFQQQQFQLSQQPIQVIDKQLLSPSSAVIVAKTIKSIIKEQKENASDLIDVDQLADESRNNIEFQIAQLIFWFDKGIGESEESSFGFIGKHTLREHEEGVAVSNDLNMWKNSPARKKIDEKLQEKLRINISAIEETQKLIDKQQQLETNNNGATHSENPHKMTKNEHDTNNTLKKNKGSTIQNNNRFISGVVQSNQRIKPEYFKVDNEETDEGGYANSNLVAVEAEAAAGVEDIIGGGDRVATVPQRPIIKKLELANLNKTANASKMMLIKKIGDDGSKCGMTQIEDISGMGYHDEFMSRVNEFSLSWRNDVEKERQKRLQQQKHSKAEGNDAQ